MAKKRCIRLNPADHEVLISLYLDRRLPIDHYDERPRDLKNLTDAFNAITERSDPPEDIIHYMRTKRKAKKWVCLGDKARKASIDIEDILSFEDNKKLEACYVKIGKNHQKGNDSFAYEPELKRELEKEFLNATGKYVHSNILLANLIRMRKAGILETLKFEKNIEHKAFNDLDKAANM